MVEELKKIYPDSYWTKKAQRLERDYPVPELKNGAFEEGVVGWEPDPASQIKISADSTSGQLDNGLLKTGGQTACFFLSPGSEARLKQRITGFEKGQRYFVTFSENARAQDGADEHGPFLVVTLDDQIITPDHVVHPVEKKGRHTWPFERVESMAFTASAREHTLQFEVRNEKTAPRSRVVFIDDIELLDWDMDKLEQTTEGDDSP